RRRHTRFSRDWSSDVCSSDLELAAQLPGPERLLAQVGQSPAAGETAEVTDLDGYHIRRSGAGSQRGQQRIVVVLEAEGLHLQLDVRVHFLEERAYFSHKGVVVREHADGKLGLGMSSCGQPQRDRK